MEMIKRFEPLFLVLMVLGALNYGIVGITDGDTNLIADVFSDGTLLNVVYVLIGVAGLAFVPKVLEALHLGGGHSMRPHGT